MPILPGNHCGMRYDIRYDMRYDLSHNLRSMTISPANFDRKGPK